MDAFLAIASRREVRDYTGTPIPREIVERILDAGRLSGSARNRQPWTFVVVGSEARRARLADCVYEPANLRGAALAVAVVLRGQGGVLDAGRAVQNMLLAAWNEGVGGCPNGIRDAEGARATLELADDEAIAVVLSLGYPATPRDPSSRTPEEWSARARRKPLDEVVRRLA